MQHLPVVLVPLLLFSVSFCGGTFGVETDQDLSEARLSQSARQRQGRFLGLLGILTGSSGLFADYYSDEDSSDVKVKAPTAPPGNWAYIPIPYFIPSTLYNNLFAAAAPQQYLPTNAPQYPPAIALHEPSNLAVAASSLGGAAESGVQLENPTVRAALRARLTRQAASKLKENNKTDANEEEAAVTAAAEEKDAADEEEAITATDASAALQEMTESFSQQQETTTTIGDKLPSAGSNSGINASSTQIPTTTTENPATATTLQSFEAGEWEYLNNGAATPSTGNNTDRFKSNQTSSYYRRRQPQSFDPDNVQFTTWYPEAAALLHPEDVTGSSGGSSSLVAGIAYPFRPSQKEQDVGSLFKPVVGPAPSSAQLGLEPPVLPEYPYAK